MNQTVFYRVFDGRQSGNNALVLEVRIVKPELMLDAYRGICDLAILHGDIKVDPDQHSLVLENDIGDRQLVCNGHGCGWW